MKVVIYTHYLKSGGAEKRASVIANYFHLHNIDVSIVTMHKVEEEYFVEQEISRYYVADSFNEYKQLSKKKRLLKLRNILINIKPDIIISFLSTYSFYATLAVRRSKELKNTKLIHAVTLYQKKYGLFERMVDRYCCRHADKIMLQCHEQLKCNKPFKNKCFVCYNPISDKWNDFIERDYSKLSLISAGRLTDQKNFSLTINAVAEAHKTNKNISLDIYGNGPLKEELNELINKLNASEYIKIYPFSFNLASEFEKHNVFVLSSKFEGFPNTLAEAMMSGLVCLSTPCPTGPSEIITDNSVGILYKNDKALCDNLLSLSKDLNLCRVMGQNARKSVKDRFEDKAVLPKLLEDISK